MAETVLDIVASLSSTTAIVGGFSVPTCPLQLVVSSRLVINLTLPFSADLEEQNSLCLALALVAYNTFTVGRSMTVCQGNKCVITTFFLKGT